jgi:hypothetical protein
MRFMLLMIPRAYQPGAEAGPEAGMPDPEHVSAMMKFNEDLHRGGHMLSGEGLHPLAKGARITFSGGEPLVTDGPFAEAKEVLGGFWMLQFASKDEAIEWVRRCPAADGDVLELRQVQEMADFSEDVVQAAREAAPEATKNWS